MSLSQLDDSSDFRVAHYINPESFNFFLCNEWLFEINQSHLRASTYNMEMEICLNNSVE